MGRFVPDLAHQHSEIANFLHEVENPFAQAKRSIVHEEKEHLSKIEKADDDTRTRKVAMEKASKSDVQQFRARR